MIEEKRIPEIRFKGFDEAWEQRKFCEILKSHSFRAYLAEPSEDGNYEVIQQGDNPVVGYSDGEPFENFEGVTLFGDHTVSLYKPTEPFFVATDGVKILSGDGFDGMYLFSTLERYKPESQGYKRHFTILKNEDVWFVKNNDEQQKIGQFSRNLDHLITLHQRKLENSENFKKAMLQKMFPKEGEKYPRLRFAGFTDAWEQRKLGKFGYFYYGKSAPKWSVTKDAKTPCVRYGELYTKHSEKIDRIYSYTNIPRENLKFSTGNEVLVPRVGEDPLDFANCAWLSIPDVAIGEMISVYNTEQNPLFTSYMFNSKLKYEFAKRVEGGNVSNLYYAYLEDILISFPSLAEQEKIASFFDEISSLITLHQRKLDNLENLKKALLQRMFI